MIYSYLNDNDIVNVSTYLLTSVQ